MVRECVFQKEANKERRDQRSQEKPPKRQREVMGEEIGVRYRSIWRVGARVSVDVYVDVVR